MESDSTIWMRMSGEPGTTGFGATRQVALFGYRPPASLSHRSSVWAHPRAMGHITKSPPDRSVNAGR